jgi:hypothetical protein
VEKNPLESIGLQKQPIPGEANSVYPRFLAGDRIESFWSFHTPS